MSDEFKDLLAAFDEDDKEQPSLEEAPESEVAVESSPAPARAGAVAGGGIRRPGVPAGRPMMKSGGASGIRPSSGVGPASAHGAPVVAAPVTPAKVAAPVIPTFVPPIAIASAGGSGKSSLLLVLVLVFSVLSVFIGLGALLKVNSLYSEIAGLNVQMKLVKESADRSWKVQCGVFTPSPTQRAQEYQMIYEEKDGKLVRRQTIIKPLED